MYKLAKKYVPKANKQNSVILNLKLSTLNEFVAMQLDGMKVFLMCS